jgi:FkbM family methyltransferase
MLRTSGPWRRLFADRTVRRRVQGVDLYMPWSHVLPDYARARDYYGQNLPELSRGLARRLGGPFKLVDVGANVGDSALQVLSRVDGEALCVEGDPYWARFLEMNVAGDPRISVELALLTATDGDHAELQAVRGHGTTRFEPAASVADGSAQVSVDALRSRHPRFADARLIKSDTDGFDPLLVPPLARAWADSTPVLFFEFDPAGAREVTGQDPNALWDRLAELGYEQLVVWDNTGDALGRLTIDAAPEAAAALESGLGLGYDFWDVAACRSDDADARAAFDELVTAPFDPEGVVG